MTSRASALSITDQEIPVPPGKRSRQSAHTIAKKNKTEYLQDKAILNFLQHLDSERRESIRQNLEIIEIEDDTDSIKQETDVKFEILKDLSKQNERQCTRRLNNTICGNKKDNISSTIMFNDDVVITKNDMEIEQSPILKVNAEKIVKKPRSFGSEFSAANSQSSTENQEIFVQNQLHVARHAMPSQAALWHQIRQALPYTSTSQQLTYNPASSAVFPPLPPTDHSPNQIKYIYNNAQPSQTQAAFNDPAAAGQNNKRIFNGCVSTLQNILINEETDQSEPPRKKPRWSERNNGSYQMPYTGATMPLLGPPPLPPPPPPPQPAPYMHSASPRQPQMATQQRPNLYDYRQMQHNFGASTSGVAFYAGGVGSKLGCGVPVTNSTIHRHFNNIRPPPPPTHYPWRHPPPNFQ